MSKQQVGPSIDFQGSARGVMESCRKVRAGSLELHTVDKQEAPKTAGPGDRIMHARLAAEGVLIIASDGSPNYPAKVGQNVGVALRGADETQLSKLLAGLSESGTVKMPLSKHPWGSQDGWLSDKFGITGRSASERRSADRPRFAFRSVRARSAGFVAIHRSKASRAEPNPPSFAPPMSDTSIP